MSGIALSELLKFKVNDWRASNYESKYPAISELFNFNLYSDETEIKNLRYLRKAQYEALETYWYLRLVEETPHIFELYKNLIPDHSELLKSLSIHLSQEDLIKLLSSGGIQNLFKKIKDDDDFHDLLEDEPFLAENEIKIEVMNMSMTKLGEPCKSLIEDFYVHHLSMGEISDKFGYTNAENAKNQKYKCLQRLKKIFFVHFKGDEEYDEL